MDKLLNPLFPALELDKETPSLPIFLFYVWRNLPTLFLRKLIPMNGNLLWFHKGDQLSLICFLLMTLSSLLKLPNNKLSWWSNALIIFVKPLVIRSVLKNLVFIAHLTLMKLLQLRFLTYVVLLSLSAWAIIFNYIILVHSRITKETYNSVIDKVQKRLAAWKSNTLSMAGRLTLLQSVTAAIPIHAICSAPCCHVWEAWQAQ